MREIKFRGMKRNPYGDIWVYGYYAIVEGTPSIICPHLDEIQKAIENKETMINKSVFHDVDVNTIGQYTGLKDKNGVEIYEGDILKNDEGLIRSVKYEMSCGSCCTQVIGFGASGDGHLDFINLNDSEIDVEVIGNIYENPELLQDKM